MIIDARSIPENETIETDVCIVGAGVAGLALAQEFSGQKFRVCLLESGGLEPDRATQSLYWGENTGHPYYPLDTARTCAFGGTSHRWLLELGNDRLGARTRPLDAIDFEQRDWVPHSGWPFDKTHLDPYFARAQSIFKIGPYDYNLETWEDPVRRPRLGFLDGQVETSIFQFGSRDTFIYDYRHEMEKAGNITAYLYANAVEIETTETAQMATRLRTACLQGSRFWIAARIFILATGAIETPRLLLLSNQAIGAGLGNQNDLVGRFFMEHPHLWSGILIPSNANVFNSTDLYKIHTVNGVTIQGKLALTEKTLRREKLLSFVTSIHPSVMPNRLQALAHASEKGASIFGLAEHRLQRFLRKYRLPRAEVFLLNSMSEQSPNPNSRVMLADERDVLGRNRVQLNWQLSHLDIHTIRRAQEIIDRELRRAGLGWLHIGLTDDTPPHNLHGGWHHMGTARMHTDPKQGVVDENCRVHGMTNLFIAPPSVFATSGYANPVLTILALAVRLADHIKLIIQ
ncbi:MAG: GMC oxidoreductase [Chloroflexota bacterium]